jgi:hypothetical protein
MVFAFSGTWGEEPLDLSRTDGSSQRGKKVARSCSPPTSSRKSRKSAPKIWCWWHMAIISDVTDVAKPPSGPASDHHCQTTTRPARPACIKRWKIFSNLITNRVLKESNDVPRALIVCRRLSEVQIRPFCRATVLVILFSISFLIPCDTARTPISPTRPCPIYPTSNTTLVSDSHFFYFLQIIDWA